uniref:Lipase domain-containing protein n=1 Tax=Timema poppense TaxID=170557 RepID=A0A7R9DCA2_TIMPO|nr:unnamed protein product [Timema poppensis]
MLNQTNLFLQTMLFVVRNINDGEEVVSTTPQSPPDDRLTRCYEPYGCFSTLYPWTDVNRPISNLPEEPYKINTNFCLYTRRNPHTCQVLETNNPMSVYRSNLARSDLTYFIAHGYLEGGHKPWIGRLTGELLKNREANVVVVDWSGGSNPPYTQAVANIRLVGVITALLVNQLLNMGVRPERIHFIGHSLGAHLGGYVGHNLQRQFHSKLGRITGLDPAEPHFGDTLPVVRLDYTDAEFVDIIHTDTSRFITGGKTTPIPHRQHLYLQTTPIPTDNTSTYRPHLYPQRTPIPTDNTSTHRQHYYPQTTILPTENTYTHR